jgi:hypothetical protein
VGDDNGRRATAAVMRYGYRRVECFGGYEPRLRGTAHAARAYWSGTFGSRSRRRVGGVAKRSEPCPHRAATCPEPQSGANRRGGENPRGRNTMCSGWSRHTDGRWQHRPGVDAPGNKRKQGATRAKPRRGGSRD